MINVWSFNSQLQLTCQQIHCWREINFHFLMNRWTDVSSDINPWMKQVKIKINGWTKRACHRFLPIDLCNRYQSNQIYRFLLTYRLINGCWFLPIDYSWLYPKMNLNIYVTLKFESMTTCFLYHVKWKKNVFFKRTCSIWLVDSHLRLSKNHWSFVEQRPYQILLTFSCRRKSYPVLSEYWLIFRSLD